MKVRSGFLLILLACMLVPPAEGQPKQYYNNVYSADYLWPTASSSYLTSTFAETRSQHFHAALDIKTWGRRGYEVYATRDGIVDRIAIGPRGYGKVIYLKHDDGSYSVYAHLLSFNSQLQQLADSVRIAEGYKFEIDRSWGWRGIKVKQGDIIGYSGASGIGPPHLHFELRTPSHKPFNPLLTNLDVKDTIAPQIQGVAVEPLAPQSSIEGNNRIYRKRTWTAGNTYRAGTIRVTGPVGLAIDAFDQSNHVTNAYAAYELSLSVNGMHMFTSRVDSFSYQETDQMFLDRIYPLLQQGKGGYQRLYIADGNTLPFYKTSKNRGRLNLPPGRHKVTIRAKDYFGNSTTASLTLDVQGPTNSSDNLSHVDKKTTSPLLQSAHHWDWFSNWVSVSKATFAQLTVGVDSTQLVTHDDRIAIPFQNSSSLFINTPKLGPLTLYRVKPNTEKVLSSTSQQGFALFPARTFYDTVSVGMTINKHRPDSLTVDMVPEAYPLRDSYKIYVNKDSLLSDTAKLSLYKYDRFDDQEWELIPTEFTKDFIIGKASSLGTFSLRRDTTAPQLSAPSVHQRPDKKWVLIIEATDNLSGIDYNKTHISVNGVPGIAEFEPEDDRFVYYHPNFEPSESMAIQITTYDLMGNKRSSSFTITK
ncbi:M23 family metallopeptidase [Fodinibius halophilus]|uniref:M23 family metallopeptidase n=1 Tax=Fodinibius halophilus TaxID=1736908 RepID=A0A6M1TIX0_9BACT|nr:M23 family metallopeptidase [Fodinibius halophilus]NGP88550.1 M23 family metallopeptidase [Fodinibius halophilus]